MTPDIALFLAIDGITNGAIYALMALSLVLVFAVTRVINIPQGEFVMFGGLTLASLQLGQFPATAAIVAVGLAAWGIADAAVHLRFGQARKALLTLAVCGAGSGLALGGTALIAGAGLPMIVNLLWSLALVTPLGPICYRLIFQPLPRATVLVYLIMAVGLHLALRGLGLVFWGPGAYRTPEFTPGLLEIPPVLLSHQSLWVVGIATLVGLTLYLFFDRTIHGKALRAAAMNPLGARLAGISTAQAGQVSFLLAALIGALSGVLISPVITAYHDMGFLIGLKGFVGAIIGGLASYPVAAAGAILVGLVEAYSTFAISAYKDALLFLLIIPVLLWRSLRTVELAAEEE